MGFITRYAKRFDLSISPQVVLDTMQIEAKRLSLSGQAIEFDALTLERCRQRYELANYKAHNALTDAQATAE